MTTQHTNETRATIAAGVIDIYKERTGADQHDALADLLADMMHWADTQGLDFDHELRRARGYYEDEVTA